ncbi:MAG: SDR family oxidoreductase [Rhodospirillaceae bacterium]|nr:SDR family oxidoreductase [Rhodospirillaceae bacterium]
MRNSLLALLLVIFAASSAHAATVLVTGSNRGLGYEFARQYAEAGWTVIATARKLDGAKELKDLAVAHKNVTLEVLDLMDEPGINLLANKYKGKPIDLVICNAGVLGDLPGQTLGGFSYENFKDVMGANVYGNLAVAQAFREHVMASRMKKIVAISSGAGIISGKGAGGNIYFYRASKVALNMSMKGLANDLRDKGVIVGILSPGAADTGMRRDLVGADRAAKDLKPADSVTSMIKVIAGLTQENTDKPLNYDGSVMPW